METCFNDILFDSTLSDSEIVERLRKQAFESKATEKEIDEGNFESDKFDKDRELLYKECESDYIPVVWTKLREESKRDLKNAYFYSVFNKKINDDETTPLFKLTKTVENELRYKLFIKFADEFVNERLNVVDKNDKIFDDCLEQYQNTSELVLTLGEMLRFIKESYYDETKSNYAFELRIFLEDNDWDITLFYSKIDKKFYIGYPKKYNNSSKHSYVYDDCITNECKKETKEILTWLISSYNL